MKWTVIWNYRAYHSCDVDLDFIVKLVGNEKFTLIVEGEEFGVVLRKEGFWFFAIADDAEAGSGLGASSIGIIMALTYLIEQLSESILSKVKV